MRGRWSSERVERLRRLWAEGVSAEAIAAEFGDISRGAVLGKVFRLRRRDHGDAQTKSQAGKTAQPSRKRAAAMSDAPAPPHSVWPWRRGPARPRMRLRPRLASPPKRGCSLFELTNASCRWPHGRPGTPAFHFCGIPEADLEHGIPYCAAHMRRAFGASADTPERPRRGMPINVSARTGGSFNRGAPRRVRS